jgi:TfoX/Sxy family transcriptional regulator of competence genes
MAYDETLAQRIREAVGPRPDVAERKMFGGLCFMTGGNMFAGVVKDELLVRIDKADHEAWLLKPGARPMDFTGRTMTGMLFVGAPGFETDASLASWVRQAYDFASSLPAKQAKMQSAPRGRKA